MRQRTIQRLNKVEDQGRKVKVKLSKKPSTWHYGMNRLYKSKFSPGEWIVGTLEVLQGTMDDKTTVDVDSKYIFNLVDFTAIEFLD